MHYLTAFLKEVSYKDLMEDGRGVKFNDIANSQGWLGIADKWLSSLIRIEI